MICVAMNVPRKEGLKLALSAFSHLATMRCNRSSKKRRIETHILQYPFHNNLPVAIGVPGKEGLKYGATEVPLVPLLPVAIGVPGKEGLKSLQAIRLINTTSGVAIGVPGKEGLKSDALKQRILGFCYVAIGVPGKEGLKWFFKAYNRSRAHALQ